MRRREFVRFLVGVGATPAILAPRIAHAQQRTLPVIGFLGNDMPATVADRMRAFHQGLKEAGFVEGDNVTVLYRSAETQIDRLPALAAELVQRRVAVLASYGGGPSLAAKAATTTIPLVFAVGEDPVRLGLVASLARPGGNATGYNHLAAELAPKRLELLHQLVPGAAKVAVLVDPSVPTTVTMLRELEPAARALGLQLQVRNASTSGEINAAFAAFARERPDALFISSGALFSSRRVQLANLASRHAIPASHSQRESVEAGGLMSYGPHIAEAFRHIGGYAGRIL